MRLQESSKASSHVLTTYMSVFILVAGCWDKAGEMLREPVEI